MWCCIKRKDNFGLYKNTDLVKRLWEFGDNTSYEGWKFNSGNYLFTTDTK